MSSKFEGPGERTEADERRRIKMEEHGIIEDVKRTGQPRVEPFDMVSGKFVIGETAWVPEGAELELNILRPFWEGVRAQKVRRRGCQGGVIQLS